MDYKPPPISDHIGTIIPSLPTQEALIYAQVATMNVEDEQWEYDPLTDQLIVYFRPSPMEQRRFPFFADIDELWIISDCWSEEVG